MGSGGGAAQKPRRDDNTLLARGNKALREKKYSSAIILYLHALQAAPLLEKVISFNVAYARKKYREVERAIGRPRVVVCGGELANARADRVSALARLYKTFADVEIIGTTILQHSTQPGQSLNNTNIPIHSFRVQSGSRYIDQALKLVASHPCDILHLSKPHMPNILLGLLYKLVWDAKVLVDIDDEEVACLGSEASIAVDDNHIAHGMFPELVGLPGKDWTRLADGLLTAFDGVTVSNDALQKRYGGTVVRYARDESYYKLTPELKRTTRERYGISGEKKVFLICGVPDGGAVLLEIATALASLMRDDVIIAFVGEIADVSLRTRLLHMKGVGFVFVNKQTSNQLHDAVVLSDYGVLFQGPGSGASQSSVPPLLWDAMRAGLVVFTTRIPALEKYIDQGACIEISHSGFASHVDRVLKDEALHSTVCETARTLSMSRHGVSDVSVLLKKASDEAPRSLQKGLENLILSLDNAFLSSLHHASRAANEHSPVTYRAGAGKRRNRETEAQRVRIVAPERPNVQPDLFYLRTAPVTVKLVAVSWVETRRDIDQVLLLLKALPIPFEVLLLLPEGLDAQSIVNGNDNCLMLSAISFPRTTTEAAAFLRILNGGILAKYENILWLNPRAVNGSEGEITRVVEAFASHETVDVGVLASDISSLDTLVSESEKHHLGAWLSRIHRQVPAMTTAVPSGAILLFRALLVKQISALSIHPSEVEIAKNQKSDRSVNLLFALIGIFCHEGSYALGAISNAGTAVGQVKSGSVPRREVKAIAFYLPQFHIIPENDSWWGRGFTEWNNVVRAKPLFRNHYQPRLPADLGFYDLRSAATQRAQAHLASHSLVHGFCYYYYWFNGKKLLNEPIEQMIASGSPNFPFCVCWANENWSRNWDGQNRYVLMEQTYSLESNRALIHEFIEMMRDSRYIRHNGKPVLLVYRIKIIPNWAETAAMWRSECRKAGLGEIHLCSIRFGLEPLEGQPQEHGLDAYVMFPPHDMNFVDVRSQVLDRDKQFHGQILDYNAVIQSDIERFDRHYPWPVHRGAMLGWDNTARRHTAARIFVGCTPLRYRSWLKGILEQEARHNSNAESLLFINAWNEWAEGTFLEPDQRYGTSYLDATKSVLTTFGVRPPREEAAYPEIPSPQPKVCSNRSIIEPKRPLWSKGRAKHKADVPTILLCAHVSGHQLFGGERSFLDVLEALSRLPVNVVVTLPSGNNKEYLNRTAELSLGVYVFAYPQWMSAREPDPHLVLMFSDIIATHNVSIVYANTIVLIEPSTAARRLKRLSVVHARELITFDDALRERIGLPVQAIIKTVFERSDFIIANSRTTQHIFAREDRTVYVPNAVNIQDLSMENSVGDKIRFGIVSSNIPKKGVADFIEIARQCQDISHLADFVVIGPENQQIEAWKKDVNAGRLPKSIKFLGYRETPKAAMTELNVLLNLSSFAESFGRTVAEAMASKRPVIAYEWGALPELVQHGNTGFLAPFGDTAKVAAYVRQFCLNKAMIRSMGAAAHARVADRFSYEVLFDHLRTAIADIQKSAYWGILEKTELQDMEQNDVNVIIPVYNAPEEVEGCLESVLKHTSGSHCHVLIINDGSSDKRIPALLKKYEGRTGLRVIHNERNIGYTKTINLGIKEAGRSDVVLLNSDTIVTPQWLEGLRASAYAEPKIGTVTAMSDNAGAYSFPMQGVANPKPPHLSHEEYARRVIAAAFMCDFVDVPTGSGFCMYIRRQLLDKIGAFDAVLFPRGYGEENEFCMRALGAGWRNIITPWTFIYHVRTASFKGEKEKLVQAGVDAVTRKYPDYAKKTKEAFSSAEILRLRAVIKDCLKEG